jgi:peroxiredoxin
LGRIVYNGTGALKRPYFADTHDSSALSSQPELAATPEKPPYERSSLVTWVGLAAIALLLVAYFVFRNRLLDTVRGERHSAVGQRLPVVDLHPLTRDAGPITTKDLQGKVTLINVWGTWCQFCTTEFPYLAAIWQKFQTDEDFQYWSISCHGDGNEAKNLDALRAETAAFLARQDVDHPTYYDPGYSTPFPGDSTRESLEHVGAFNGYPTTVVLDRDGIIRGVWEATNSAPQVEKLIAELLRETRSK